MTIIGGREIDVFLLPDMSSAELARRATRTNNSNCPAFRRRRRGEAVPSGEAAPCCSDLGYVGTGKWFYYSIQLIFGQPRLGTRTDRTHSLSERL